VWLRHRYGPEAERRRGSSRVSGAPIGVAPWRDALAAISTVRVIEANSRAELVVRSPSTSHAHSQDSTQVDATELGGHKSPFRAAHTHTCSQEAARLVTWNAIESMSAKQHMITFDTNSI
jgi:hypothetical protein